MNPIFEREVPSCYSYYYYSYSITLRIPPLDSETGWTGELGSNPVLLIFENLDHSIFFS